MLSIIDLRSDTVTRPSTAMLKQMMQARVGDDVFGDDPTVIQLEDLAANMLGKEQGLFCASGTMANQIAIKVHTNPGQEIICDKTAHVYNYEGGGIAFNSGCSVKLIDGIQGQFTAKDVEGCINPDDIHFASSGLVVAENTSNKGGGSCWKTDDLKDIAELCRKNNLRFHLDGARLFNALVAKNQNAHLMSSYFDSISICLSKGLGAPVGSVLLGSADFIKQARRIRKVFGGGMRQAGYLAAAGVYALNNNIARLPEDHRRASILAESLDSLPFVEYTIPPETNILIFKLKDEVNANDFLSYLKKQGILAAGFGPQMIRFVLHLDIDNTMLTRATEVLRKYVLAP